VARHDFLDDAHLARLVVVHDGRVAEVVQREEQEGAGEEYPPDARLAEKASLPWYRTLDTITRSRAPPASFTGGSRSSARVWTDRRDVT
jgi:hypothetical protein